MAGILSNPQMWANGLQALGGGLLTLGAPTNQRAQVGQQALSNFQNMIYQQQQQKERDFLLNRQISEEARQYARQAKQDAAAAAQQQAQQSAIGTLPPELRTYAQADPSLLGDYAQQQFFPKNEAPKTVGGMQFDPQLKQYVPIPGYTEQAEAIARAGRTPPQPKTPSIITLVDPKGNRKSFFNTDPQIGGLIQQGWTEPQASMFPAPPTGYVVDPANPGALAAIPGGPADPANPKNVSDTERLNAGYAERLAAADAVLNDPAVTKAALDPYQSKVSSVPMLGNYLASGDAQRYQQAKSDFITAQLRKESGASISPGEFATAEKQYFPQPGDTPAQIAQKAESRQRAIANMTNSAGPAYKPTPIAPAADRTKELQDKYPWLK